MDGKVFSSTSEESLIGTSIPENNLMIKKVYLCLTIYQICSRVHTPEKSSEKFIRRPHGACHRSSVRSCTGLRCPACPSLGEAESKAVAHSGNSGRTGSSGLEEPSNVARS